MRRKYLLEGADALLDVDLSLADELLQGARDLLGSDLQVLLNILSRY